MVRDKLSVVVNGRLTVDDVEVLFQAAIDGTGLAFTLEDHVNAHHASAHQTTLRSSYR
jgi:hypothetical protein